MTTTTIRLTITTDDGAYEYAHKGDDVDAALTRLHQYVEMVSVNHAGGTYTTPQPEPTTPQPKPATPRTKPKDDDRLLTRGERLTRYTDSDGRLWLPTTPKDTDNPDTAVMWRPAEPDDAAPAHTILTFEDMKAIYG